MEAIPVRQEDGFFLLKLPTLPQQAPVLLALLPSAPGGWRVTIGPLVSPRVLGAPVAAFGLKVADPWRTQRALPPLTVPIDLGNLQTLSTRRTRDCGEVGVRLEGEHGRTYGPLGIIGAGASQAPLCRLRRAPLGRSTSASRRDRTGRGPRRSEQHVVEGRTLECLQIPVESAPRNDHVGDDRREAFGKELVADRRQHSRQQLELPVGLVTGGGGEPPGFTRPWRMQVRKASARTSSSPRRELS